MRLATSKSQQQIPDHQRCPRLSVTPIATVREAPVLWQVRQPTGKVLTLTAEQLYEMHRSGAMAADTPIRRPGASQWETAGAVADRANRAKVTGANARSGVRIATASPAAAAGKISNSAKLAQALEAMQGKAYARAEPLLRELEQTGLASPELWYSLGFLEFQKRNWRPAKLYFQRAIAHAPSHANALFFLGMLEKYAGNRGSAHSYFENALKYDPTHQGALREAQQMSIAGSSSAAAQQLPDAVTNLVLPNAQQYDDYQVRVAGKYRADLQAELRNLHDGDYKRMIAEQRIAHTIAASEAAIAADLDPKLWKLSRQGTTAKLAASWHGAPWYLKILQLVAVLFFVGIVVFVGSGFVSAFAHAKNGGDAVVIPPVGASGELAARLSCSHSCFKAADQCRASCPRSSDITGHVTCGLQCSDEFQQCQAQCP